MLSLVAQTGGKMFMHESEWEQAFQTFLEAFKNFNQVETVLCQGLQGHLRVLLKIDLDHDQVESSGRGRGFD